MGKNTTKLQQNLTKFSHLMPIVEISLFFCYNRGLIGGDQ